MSSATAAPTYQNNSPLKANYRHLWPAFATQGQLATHWHLLKSTDGVITFLCEFSYRFSPIFSLSFSLFFDISREPISTKAVLSFKTFYSKSQAQSFGYLCNLMKAFQKTGTSKQDVHILSNSARNRPLRFAPTWARQYDHSLPPRGPVSMTILCPHEGPSV